MEADRFEALLRSLSTSPSRRGTLRLLVGTALGSLLSLPNLSTEAKKKGGKGKGKDKKKNKKKPDCKGFRPTRCGQQCCSLEETCRGGKCVNHCNDGVKNFDETDTDCGGSCRDIRKCRLSTCW